MCVGEVLRRELAHMYVEKYTNKISAITIQQDHNQIKAQNFPTKLKDSFCSSTSDVSKSFSSIYVPQTFKIEKPIMQ